MLSPQARHIGRACARQNEVALSRHLIFPGPPDVNGGEIELNQPCEVVPLRGNLRLADQKVRIHPEDGVRGARLLD
jgi:predicted DNA-binding protein with PD1-like motif